MSTEKNILSFTTEIQSVLSFGPFDEGEDLLISASDPNDNNYVSFYINPDEAKQIIEHLTLQLIAICKL